MKITLERKYKTFTYVIGNLYIDGKFFSNTLEDTDRNLDDSMSLAEIMKLKKPAITAIPTGTYDITLDVISPKYKNDIFYKEVCEGKVPRLLNVKGYSGVLIHAGNSIEDTEGCILVGMNKEKGKVLESRATFKNLYNKLKEAKAKGEKITIKII